MITLDFKGPFDLADFNKLEDVNSPGIYIWGFKDLIHSNPNKVVPYYVGITSKSIIKTIINRHLKKIDLIDSTYMRLSDVFMHLYFYSNTPSFPILNGRESKTKPLAWKGWTKNDYGNYLEYFNNFDFLTIIKNCSTPLKKINGDNFPISNVVNLNDTLLNRINKNNFWIYYACIDINSMEYNDFKKLVPIPKSKKRNHDQAVLEIFESFVKFSLKGNTISKSIAYNRWLCFPQIVIKNSEYLFKDSPSKIFNGNY